MPTPAPDPSPTPIHTPTPEPTEPPTETPEPPTETPVFPETPSPTPEATPTFPREYPPAHSLHARAVPSILRFDRQVMDMPRSDVHVDVRGAGGGIIPVRPDEMSVQASVGSIDIAPRFDSNTYYNSLEYHYFPSGVVSHTNVQVLVTFTRGSIILERFVPITVQPYWSNLRDTNPYGTGPARTGSRLNPNPRSSVYNHITR